MLPSDPFARLLRPPAAREAGRSARDPDAEDRAGPGICSAADGDGHLLYAARRAAARTAHAHTPVLPAREPRPAPSGLVLRASSGETVRLARALTVGSAADAGWVLADPFVSQRHATLSPGGADGAAVVVRDCGSKNGTFLNGARIQHGELHVGDCLVLGHTRIRLEAGTEDSPLRGPSAAMQRVRAQIGQFARAGLPVLVLGESGTGKELVARALHAQSGRAGALITVNCGALPRELIESELFGHERGSFTGAQRSHRGCFGEADGGTLFLDEIGELPLELQPRLLRALESRTVRPVGAARELPVDVRIVAATHRDLERAVAAGTFRQDLYYRLCALELTIPPLRERPEDIGPLVTHFLAEHGGAVPLALPSAALALVAAQPWPGNVRQLKNAVLRAVHLHTGGPELSAAELIGDGRPSGATPEPARPAAPASGAHVPIFGRRFSEIERDVYLHALTQTGGNRRAAAELLDVPKSTLHDKLRRLGIDPDGP